MADSSASETKSQADAQADAPTLVPPPQPAKSGPATPENPAPVPLSQPEAPVQNGSSTNSNGNGGNGAHAAAPAINGEAPTVIEIPAPDAPPPPSKADTPPVLRTVPTAVFPDEAKPPVNVIQIPATPPRPLAPPPDSPFGGPSSPLDLPGAPPTIPAGGAVASAAHLPSVANAAPPASQSNRIPPSYIPMPSGVIPMPSSAAWQKVVNQQIPAAPPQAVLHATGLRKKFGRREVVRGVEIQVGAGEIVGLLGRNGAGKTTTFRMIMGLLHPDQGKVMYENRDISRMPMYERANRGIGYLAQQPSIFQRLSVEENLLAILELQERDKKKRYERLEGLIADLGLNTVRKSMASVLSGGERRRLEIARAMSLRPRVVLFDEPFAGIDPIAVSEIQGILRDLKGQGVGVLLTDHNVRETLTITDRTYIMDEGTIWIHGPPREIVANPDARARYLGHDFRLDF